jgi:hypothetical protein
MNLRDTTLEHFQKYCSHAGVKKDKAVFLGFGLRFGSVTGLLQT